MKLFFVSVFSLFVSMTCVAQVRVMVSNTTAFDRSSESVVVDWGLISRKLALQGVLDVMVVDHLGHEVPSQVLFEGEDRPSKLLFQADVKPHSKTHYKIVKAVASTYDTLTYGRLVPERKDDFAWENNRVAYRMYGPALEATGELSQGVDLWLKRTPDLIINRWYTDGYDYHTDKGEGLDCYSVGRSLGCGASAPLIDGKLRMMRNFTHAQLLDSGPLRTSFRLFYAPVQIDGIEIVQTVKVSLDANSNLNHIEVVYNGDFDSLIVASGIVLRGAKPEELIELPCAVSYAQPMGAANGTAYLAVITQGAKSGEVVDNHIVKKAVLRSGERYTYRSGGYWSRFGISSGPQWLLELKNEVEKFTHPLVIRAH